MGTDDTKLYMFMLEPFGEIIESSLTHCVAQCWEWEVMPSFGACIKIPSETIDRYCIVHSIAMGPIDNIRKPTPFKKTLNELKEEHPHIFEFLKTTFACTPIAYRKKGPIHFGVVPHPPKIHEFVHALTPAEMRLIFAQEQFIQILFALQQQFFNIDELIFAAITQAHDSLSFKKEQLVSYLETYALLTGSDYRRTKLFAKRLETIL